MKAREKNRLIYVIVFLLLGGGFLYLLISSLSSNGMYFLNVSEALAKGLGNIKHARLFGKVGRQVKETQGGVRFSLLDKRNPSLSIPIFYKGKLPDTFAPGIEVIVEGKMKGGVFRAYNLMTKCPSKYKKAGS